MAELLFCFVKNEYNLHEMWVETAGRGGRVKKIKYFKGQTTTRQQEWKSCLTTEKGIN
jgi:hypothetical protein